MGRRRPLGLGLLLALAVEPPLLLPLLFSAPQAGLPAKSLPSLLAASLSSPRPSVNQAGTAFQRSAGAGEQGSVRDELGLSPVVSALLSWGSVALAPESASRSQGPD